MPYGQNPFVENQSIEEDQIVEVGGRYQIREKIGKGGMGTVYRIYDKLLSRELALKMFTLHGGKHAEEERKRFQREAATITKLRHENIIRLYDCGQHDGRLFFTMDLVDGVNLFEKLKQKKRGLSAKYASELMLKIADAIFYANQQGVIHRDLKPDNIMINKNGTPIVMDFGLAKVDFAETKLTCDGTMLGTLMYIAPEYIEGTQEAADQQNDVYALGVILYEALTGFNPFATRDNTETIDKILYKKVPKLRKKNPRIPKSLEAICLKAMERNKKNRYKSALEFKNDLQAFLRGKKIAYKTPYSFPRHLFNQKNVALLLVFAIMILVILTVSIAWANF